MQILPCMAVIGDHRKETSTAHFADLQNLQETLQLQAQHTGAVPKVFDSVKKGALASAFHSRFCQLSAGWWMVQVNVPAPRQGHASDPSKWRQDFCGGCFQIE